jgi:anti-sigma-K factor RskA
MRTCQEFSELYELYAMGVLDAENKSEMEEHLGTGCPVCSNGIKSATALVSLLATMPEQVQPPARLRRRVLASAGIEKPNWGWIAAFAAVSVASIIAVVWLNTQNRQRDVALAEARAEIHRTAADLASAQSALQFLNEPETKQVVFGQGQRQPPRGRVLVNAQRGVLLIASNLPPAPSGKIYELWVISKQGVPQPAGLFQSNLQGDALYLRGGALDMTTAGAIAVTLEPASGSNAPTTTPIVVAPVVGL